MVRKSLVLSIAFLLLFAPFQLVAQPSKIHVSAPSKSLTCFPAHLTREKGFYRAEGLDVDFVVMKPQVALQALIAGDVGYTTALGSTMRAGVRGLPLRVVMTIADKPLFALMARPGVNSVEELKGKLVGRWNRNSTRYPTPPGRSTGVSCNDDRSKTDTLTNLGFSFCGAGLGPRIWR